MKQSYEVSILNQKLTLKSDASDQYVQKVADYLNKKIYDVKSQAKAISSLNIVMLAALNIADELLQLKKRKEETNLKIEEKIKSLIELVEKK